MRLRELAHSRTGDKGNTSNISVIAYKPEDYPRLAQEVTTERVRACFPGLSIGRIERFELPALGALNFILHDALAGGVTQSLALDAHGKCIGAAVLDMDLPET
ncbi:AtuA-related protein [Xanthobacter sp. TB0139]|uniref:AtuA-related protein n=1 Tax=Xanthobacter sp. TB0139 TaxID=3459178 RepID=UPI004039E574